MTERLTGFVDPRQPDTPHGKQRAGCRSTADPTELAELHRLCKEGRLYDVETWIQADRPLQLTDGPALKRSRTSALEIALESLNQALVLLLLRNGYDPNLEPQSPLELALRSRRCDLLDLLMEHGADPHRVNLEVLFDSYKADQWVRFQALGVDLTAGHALAEALGYHTSNKPLFGFAKRHRERDPKIQTELNIALAHHASEGNEKGVQLCLWAGADPHARVISLRWSDPNDTDDEGRSAIYEACDRGDAETLKRFRPEPSRDDFEELYRAASSGAVIDVLTKFAMPKDVGEVIQSRIWWISFDTGGLLGYGGSSWKSIDALKHLFQAGIRWTSSPKEQITNVRQLLLKASDHNFVDLMKLLAANDHCAPDILKELGRTPSMQARMKKVGFIPPSQGEKHNPYQLRPTRSREVLVKFGVEPPKPPKPRPSPTVHIGNGPWNGTKITLTRQEVYERVWSEPVEKLAAQWGMSGRGLAKACERVLVPVPPRGYWARLAVGQKVRQTPLPRLRAGEVEEIVLRLPEGPPSAAE